MNNPIPPTIMLAEALRSQMPSCKTQMQFNTFMPAFDAFRLLVDSVFSMDPQREVECRDIFEKALKACREVTEIGQKLEEIPIESRSKASSSFTQPPNEFHEYDIQKRLLTELLAIDTWDKLTEWYAATKELQDRVMSQPLRNGLFDQIRAKRIALQPKVEG